MPVLGDKKQKKKLKMGKMSSLCEVIRTEVVGIMLKHTGIILLYGQLPCKWKPLGQG